MNIGMKSNKLSFSAGALTDASAKNTFIFRLAQSFSNPETVDTPGEKQASIPTRSSGTR